MDSNTRLIRRLERERKARIEAEGIAEEGIRELYDKQRQLSLVQSVATAANQAATSEVALQFAIKAVCQFSKWPVGHVYRLADDGSRELIPTEMWHFDPPAERFETFRKITEATRIPAGIGLPGRVLSTGTPAWIVDIHDDKNFPRAHAAAEIGVRSGFAFPVAVQRQVAVVLEFFNDHPAEPDEELLSLMTHIGTQLGRVIEREWADERVHQSELRYRLISELTSDYAYSLAIGLDGLVTPDWVGGAVERITGYTADELESFGGGFEIIHPEDRPIALQRLSRLIQGETDVSEFRIITKSGAIRVLREIGRPVLNSEGRLVRIYAAAQDVTEHRQAEDEIRALNTELESRVLERTAELSAALRELEAFSYSVSHDLRAPLRSLNGFSEALLEDYGDRLDAQAREYLDFIRYDSQRMGGLIDDLLGLARVTRSEMQRDVVDLSDIAHATVAELQRRQPSRKAVFTIADAVVAHGDQRLLRIVLSNLLENAWKYTGKRGEARIEFGVGWHDGEACYYIRDNGAGFDMRYAGKLFQAFQRLHSEAEFEGSGIGLATVDRIVRRHGGRVWAEGTIDEGATFYFTLAVPPIFERTPKSELLMRGVQ